MHSAPVNQEPSLEFLDWGFICMVGEAVSSIKEGQNVRINPNLSIHLDGELEIAAWVSYEYHVKSFFLDPSFTYGCLGPAP